MSDQQRSYYSQNETANRKLIKSLVDQAGITKGDIVYDIGAGRGNITEALLARGARVVSIENDSYLFQKLEQRFADREAVSLHHADFLKWEFSGHRYKVFANIPFIQTADIVKKLLNNPYPPEDCYLIMQKEAALKYAGIPKETLASLLIKPVFWVDIIRYFDRRDFSPPPRVDIVLVQFQKRGCRLVPENRYQTYRDFIVYCREGAHKTVKQALSNLFTYQQIKAIAALGGLNLQSRPEELNLMQYLCIFQFLSGDDFKKAAVFRGAEARLAERRADLPKIHRTDVTTKKSFPSTPKKY